MNIASSTSHHAAHYADDTRVALIKSLATNNRFYTLASADSGIANAGTVQDIPHELQLGIAYPCLEDDLNDFAVIRTSFETLELFSDDAETQSELKEMIQDARGNLTRRLMELLERLIAKRAHFLGTDLTNFKAWTLKLIEHGISRYDIDTAMKVNVFSSVASFEQGNGMNASPRYLYEFHNSETAARISKLAERDFLVALFSDVLDSVLDDDNYLSRYTFDKKIFQQFIALLFVTYAATEPVFYGTHREDYGVSRERDMENTPLYRAVGAQLRSFAGLPPRAIRESLTASPDDDWDAIALTEIADRAAMGASAAHLPAVVSGFPAIQPQASVEENLLSPIAAICAIAQQLYKSGHNPDLVRLICIESSQLVQELKQQGILSPLAYDPGAIDLDDK